MSNADLGQFRPVEIEVPTVQPCQVPVYPAAGGVTVQNEDPTGVTTVDVSSSPVFATGTVRTLTPGTSAYCAVGPVWCRVTPGQATKPAAAIIVASPGQITAPNTTFNIAPGEAVYVNLPPPSAGADWTYKLPTPLRLVAVRAILTTSTAIVGRQPYLWQVVTGDTLPTMETLLSPDDILPSWTVVLNASMGAKPDIRSDPSARPASSVAVSTGSSTLYTVPSSSRFNKGVLFATQVGGAGAIVLFVNLNGSTLGAISLGVNGSAPLTLPDLVSGDVITANTSSGTATVTLAGTLQSDNRRVSSLSGLLMPTGSSVQSATAGLQAADQWSDIQLAFTAS
jgi:hypothetical protein